MEMRHLQHVCTTFSVDAVVHVLGDTLGIPKKETNECKELPFNNHCSCSNRCLKCPLVLFAAQHYPGLFGSCVT